MRRLGGIAVDASRDDAVAVVRVVAGGIGADVAIETAGTPSTMRQAMEMVKTGGVVVWVGMPPVDDAVLPVMDQLAREYDVRSVFRYANAYPPRSPCSPPARSTSPPCAPTSSTSTTPRMP